MLFQERITLFSESPTKQTYCGENVDFLVLKGMIGVVTIVL
jgi:hypothetical protein